MIRPRRKPVPGFPGYMVGDDGSIWSAWQKTALGYGGGTFSTIGPDYRKLFCTVSRYGYRTVGLRRNHKTHRRFVHALVLEAFVGPRPLGLQCRHLDGNRTNNRIENLCWGTAQENQDDINRHGTRWVPVGEDSPNSKLSNRQAIAIKRLLLIGVRGSELAAIFGVTKSTITDLKKGRTWRHIDGTFKVKAKMTADEGESGE